MIEPVHRRTSRIAFVCVLVLGSCARRDTPAPSAERPGMVLISAGPFLMGSRADDSRAYEHERVREQPQHEVFVGAYYLDVHEVTNAEYERVHPHRRDEASPCDTCPVTKVSWSEAASYCAAQHPAKRLPTEAEWEKAAKAGGDGYPTEAFDAVAWYAGNSITRAQPVGMKAPNAWGLHDMLGNVREWTADWFATDYYQRSEHENPKGPPTGQRHVERGGAFFLPERGVTATIRYNHPPTFRLYFLGFRCAQDP